jgi:hypothetical protein
MSGAKGAGGAVCLREMPLRVMMTASPAFLEVSARDQI